MKQLQRYHAENPLDPRAKNGVMYPGKDGEWVRFEDWERAARELPAPLAWTEAPPNEQGYYFWWNGNPDDAPYGCFVLLSGSNGKCFVQGKDMQGAPWCEDRGGWWCRIPVPSLPVLEVEL